MKFGHRVSDFWGQKIAVSYGKTKSSITLCIALLARDKAAGIWRKVHEIHSAFLDQIELTSSFMGWRVDSQ
jgi:hypothetical protein